MEGGAFRPRIAKKARLVWDRVRARHVLLYPERGLALNDVAARVVKAADGTRTPSEIAHEIARAFPDVDATEIARDVDAFLSELFARALLDPFEGNPLPLPAHSGGSEVGEGEGHAPSCLVAELTYRCPLHCPYCSNPVELERGVELTTTAWNLVLDDAAALGVLEVHFTGGEPLARNDLEVLIARARHIGLYSNLITSGVPLTRARLEALVSAGLDHVQLSVQSSEAEVADRVAGTTSHAHKLEVARWVKELGLPLTLNCVLHRANVDEAARLVALAESVGADRLELANVQLLGWALSNRAALLPSKAAIDEAFKVADAARKRLAGRMEIVFVLPDYVASRPRACMDGWGRRYMVIDPYGYVLPCHAARSIGTLEFERVTDRSLASIWSDNSGLQAFRGDAWMPEPCKSCDRKAIDYGGCRCQAMQLTGDAASTDPACSLAPTHDIVLRAQRDAEDGGEKRYLFRGFPAART